MQYVKKILVRNGSFEATLSNGKKTNNRAVAEFYMIMQDKKANKEEVKAYIKVGRMTNSSQSWDEIEEAL